MLFFPYSKTILLGATIPCMWMNLILLTSYVFNGRPFLYTFLVILFAFLSNKDYICCLNTLKV